MGADEYLPDVEYPKYPQLERYAKEQYGPLATAKDGIIGLINEVNALVKSHGKQLRVWNDSFAMGGTTIDVDQDVIVEWWHDISPFFPNPTNPKVPMHLLLEGRTIQNASFFPTYFYEEGGQIPPPPVAPMYDDWAVHRFRGFVFDQEGGGTPWHEVSPSEPRNLGSKLHIWNDQGKWSEEATAAGIFPRLRIMAQKTWESPQLVATYAEFEPIIQHVGTAPSSS